MTSFSQREGYKPVRDEIQIEDMDEPLRNGLWDAVGIYGLSRWGAGRMLDVSMGRKTSRLCDRLWHNYFKKPLDTIPYNSSDAYKAIRSYFFECEWYEVYDFLEFVVDNYPDDEKNQNFMDFCNSVLEREVSGYRFIQGKIAQITSDEEIAEIEKALAIPVDPVANQLKAALDLLANRESPNYRDSIKESISAVESICKMIAQDEKATLGQVLPAIESTTELHPDLKEALRKLYHYTSDADGIRHGLMDAENLDQDDARFMLVICSAFINYLKSKSSRAGMDL